LYGRRVSGGDADVRVTLTHRRELRASDSADAQRSADALMLRSDEIPGGPWGTDGWKETEDNFRQWVCGVDVEPEPPVDAFVARWMSADGHSVLFQNVRPVGAASAQRVVTELGESLRTCRKDRRARDPKAEVVHTYDITPLTIESGQAVAWRQRQTSGSVSDIDVDMVYFVERDSLVTFVVFTDGPLPGPAGLDELVRAVRQKR
jgi:hypothetical protein